MNIIIRNSFVLILAVLAGSAVNMGLIILAPSVIPPPEGVDVTNMESLAASMHLFDAKHFLFPFLAHALGTLAGAYLVSLLAPSHRMVLAMGVGGLFLIGGIINVFMLPSPMWFDVIDLAGAYIPMAWLGNYLAKAQRPGGG